MLPLVCRNVFLKIFKKKLQSPFNSLTKGGLHFIFLIINHRFIGPRIIVFVLGGITCSEMRVAYELMMQTKSEIIVGGTSLLTPQNFIDGLGSLV